MPEFVQNEDKTTWQNFVHESRDTTIDCQPDGKYAEFLIGNGLIRC